MVLTLIICFLVAVMAAFSRDALNLWLSKKVGFPLKETITKEGVPIVTLKNGEKDLTHYHHPRGFEDCFEHEQNIPFRAML